MSPLPLSVPSHLSIFVTDPDTGRPTPRLPLYVEVAVPRIVPLPPRQDRFREPIRAALFEIDPTAEPVSTRVEAAAQEALGRAVDEASRDQLVTQPDRVRDLFHQAFGDVLAATQRERIGDVPAADLVQLLEAAIRRAALPLGIGLLPERGDAGIVWAHPLGVLTTDHVGYASFDLTRLGPDVQALLAEAIEARRNDPGAVPKLAIWVYPYGHPERFEALSQARFALDAVVARLAITWNTLPPALNNMGPRALQNPSLTDWRLSPASFAASPKTLVGADGCEELVPANLALQQFVLRHVVRLADPVPDAPALTRPKAAYIDEYKVSWYSLGHSLGEILYSLPLAPGETVKLAVIDWSWDSLTTRDETTRLTEDVLHRTHRDRTVTETVKAGIRELQHGSSFMGGTAGAAGATGAGKIDSFNVGGAVGQTWSLGGATATSDGSRDIAAEMVQRVSDSFSQASSVQRELNSTVVIHARQEEKESIQTRTFSNYNHSHTLTILYYEVLRHYRVTVEWVRRRHAALVAVPKRVDKFDEDAMLKYRHVLESSLLDPSLKSGFDALAKLATIKEDRGLHGLPKDADFHHLFDGDLEFSFFEFGTKTSTLENDDMTNEPENSLRIWALKADGALIPLGRWGDFNPEFNVGGRFRNRGEMTWFLAYLTPPGTRLRWHELAGFMIDTRTDTWRVEKLAINGFAPPLPPPGEGEPRKPAGPRKVVLRELRDANLLFGKYRGSLQDDDDLGDNTFTEINPPPPPPAPILSPEKSLTPEERHQLKKLTDHCALYKEYYASLIVLNTDPSSIAIQFEKEPWSTLGPQPKLVDRLEPTPLDVFGSYVAYPRIHQPAGIDDTVIVDLAAALNGDDPARRQRALDQIAAMDDADRQTVLERLPLASARSERLITLPTRGVFAEGKLGHCNVSEVIDNTRFWKWEEHPIPFTAPDIAAAVPIQPNPQQVTATPTAFPQAVVSISNPTPLPEPTGLADVLKLLGTSNIFRDMSGRAEVADLLKKLSDKSIDIAEAANKARDIQAKYGAELDKQQKAYDLDLYKAANEAAGKDAEVRRAAQAQASKAQAEAAKANADAGKALAAAAKELPQGPLQDGAYNEAARVIQGSPVTNKVVAFEARAYDGKTLEGKFELTVRDILRNKDIIKQEEVGYSFARAFSFSTPEPVIGADAKRLSVATIRILDEVVSLPVANVASPKEPYVAGKSHQVITVTLAQTSRTVSFKAASTNAAVTELMNKWGTEFGASNALATKIVADYEKKHQITHPAQVEPSYSIRVPVHDYELTVSSR